MSTPIGSLPDCLLPFDTLPRSQRQALELRVVEELPYKEVALSLDCSEVAASRAPSTLFLDY